MHSSKSGQIKVWASRKAKKNGMPSVIRRGTMPQLFRSVVFMLDGGVERAEEILTDIKRDRKKLKEKWGE